MTKRTYIGVLTVALAVVLAAGGLLASNMGFKLNYPLQATTAGVSLSGTNTLAVDEGVKERRRARRGRLVARIDHVVSPLHEVLDPGHVVPRVQLALVQAVLEDHDGLRRSLRLPEPVGVGSLAVGAEHLRLLRRRRRGGHGEGDDRENDCRAQHASYDVPGSR